MRRKMTETSWNGANEGTLCSHCIKMINGGCTRTRGSAYECAQFQDQFEPVTKIKVKNNQIVIYADYITYRQTLIEHMQERMLDDMLKIPKFRAMLIRKGWRNG